jgi:hypothetical protein
MEEVESEMATPGRSPGHGGRFVGRPAVSGRDPQDACYL